MNGFLYAKNTNVIIELLKTEDNTGVSLIFKDEGPGIENLEKIMQADSSTIDKSAQPFWSLNITNNQFDLPDELILTGKY